MNTLKRARPVPLRLAGLALAALLMVGLWGCGWFRPDDPPPLDTPTDLSATEGIYADRIRVAWEPVAEALLYVLERSTLEEGPYHTVAETAETSYDDTDVELGLVYWYRVRGCDEERCSAWSEPEEGYADLPTGEAPATPTGVSASRGDFPDRIRLQWNASPGATQYEVHRADEQFGVYSEVGTSSENTYDDTDVSPGRTYWYRVRACNPAGCSLLSESAAWGFAEAAPDGPPNPPRAAAATDGQYDDRIRVTWTIMAGATRYDVFRSTTEGGTYTQIGSATDTIYEDVHDATTNPLTACADYWYRIVACNADGCSGYSPAASGYRGTRMTSTVSGLTATDTTFPDRIRVSWEPLAGAEEYRIYRNTTATPIAVVDEPSFDDTTITQATPTSYAYYVQACGTTDCGCGPLSLPASGSASNLPGTPVEVTATGQTGPARIVLSWEEGASIVPTASYDVFRATSQTGQYTKINATPVTNTSYTDTTGTSGSTYWYYVRAVNANGSSGPSSTASATMP